MLDCLQSQSQNFGEERNFSTMLEIETDAKNGFLKHLLYADKISTFTSLNAM
jgi:hypothetical protein